MLRETGQPGSAARPKPVAPARANLYGFAPYLVLAPLPTAERVSIEDFSELLALELAFDTPANLRS